MEDRQHTTKECADKLILETILQDKFFYFKAEEGGVAVATATDDNCFRKKFDQVSMHSNNDQKRQTYF